VEEAAVELDQDARKRRVPIGHTDGGLLSQLPPWIRQAVRTRNSLQETVLEHGVRSIRQVREHTMEPEATRQPLARLRGVQEPLSGCASTTNGARQNAQRIQGIGDPSRHIQNRVLVSNSRRPRGSHDPLLETDHAMEDHSGDLADAASVGNGHVDRTIQLIPSAGTLRCA